MTPGPEYISVCLFGRVLDGCNELEEADFDEAVRKFITTVHKSMH